MKISVIVPTYNEESVIAATLAHASAVLSPHELFIVDGQSTDGTVAAARGYGRVLTASRSRGANLNDAASLATGDVLLFLHADTHLPVGAARAIERALYDPRVVGGAFRLRFDDPGWKARAVALSVNVRSTLLNTFFGDQAMFVRREVFARCGGYRNWSVMEDLEILPRLRRHGRLALLRPAAITSARRHRNSGWLRTIATIWAISLLFRLGMPGEVLIRWYRPAR
jgi:rSAM/selenodomain-associated transferase 2